MKKRSKCNKKTRSKNEVRNKMELESIRGLKSSNGSTNMSGKVFSPPNPDRFKKHVAKPSAVRLSIREMADLMY